jgi:hypothetical protein
MALKSFIAQTGQSVFDLASLAYGDNTAIIQLKTENPFLDINSNNYGGLKINYTPTLNSNYAKQQLIKLIPASACFKDNKNNYLQQEDGFDFELEDNSGKIELEN